ncbi:molybdenum ABC transporter ATP-binding protein [Aliikangiella coralliicola]|uniref:molybdenum ABC transporter ATP-binding protein n=1 Tax=Aliikangiella coralliicola TaxID=2592383 RepID=UPI00143E0030|nr:molybdenum ABC transporter ATP-binding protein [Aliikangiella coralliicola]
MNNNNISAKFSFRNPNFYFDIELNIPVSGITAVFGQSGAGKTTLLRCIAGLEKIAGGQLKFGEQQWQSADQFLPVHQRPIGYVFQESALFEHLNVLENLNYGRKRAHSGVNQEEFERIVELMGISQLLSNNAALLSGGEKQRVAIARALMMKPEILLMDEPLASLDRKRKQEVMEYLENLHRELSIPILYVSHSVEEVTRLATYIVVLERGKIVKHGDIKRVLSDHILQDMMADEPFTLLFGQVISACNEYCLTEVKIDGHTIYMPRQNVSDEQLIRLHLNARDISITLQKPQQTSVLNVFECQVIEIGDATGNGQCMVRLSLNNTELLAKISDYSRVILNLRPAQKVFAQIKAVSVVQ